MLSSFTPTPESQSTSEFCIQAPPPPPTQSLLWNINSFSGSKKKKRNPTSKTQKTLLKNTAWDTLLPSGNAIQDPLGDWRAGKLQSERQEKLLSFIKELWIWKTVKKNLSGHANLPQYTGVSEGFGDYGNPDGLLGEEELPVCCLSSQIPCTEQCKLSQAPD